MCAESRLFGNLFLGMRFRTCKNFWTSTDFSLVESPKILTNTKATPPLLRLRFCNSQNLVKKSNKKSLIKFLLLFAFAKRRVPLNFINSNSPNNANSQNLNQNNSVRSTQTRPLRGAKNRNQASSSASADFLLEAEKRGSPPKSEKAAAFWRVGGAGRGVQPLSLIHI